MLLAVGFVPSLLSLSALKSRALRRDLLKDQLCYQIANRRVDSVSEEGRGVILISYIKATRF